jgi:thioesterase domain-containing protein
LQSDFGREQLVPIDEMAAEYVEALRAAQSRGPYHLGGWSFGGLVAYEMAQQLHEQGEAVASLVLIDSWTPTLRNSTTVDGDLELLAAFVRDLGGWRVEDLDISRESFGHLDPEEQLGICLERLQMANVVPSELTVARVHPLLNTFKRNVRAGARYVARPYSGSGRITLVRTREQVFEDFPSPAQHPDYGWSELANGQVEVHELPGNHYTLLTEPHVSTVAGMIQRALSGSPT